MKSMIRRVPVPIAGVMLGFAAFGNFLKSYSNLVWILMELVSVALLVLLVLKALLYPEDLRRDMKNPAIAGAAGTFSMGLMFLAVSLKSVSVPAGVSVWWVSLVGGAGASRGADRVVYSVLCALFSAEKSIHDLVSGLCGHCGGCGDEPCFRDAGARQSADGLRSGSDVGTDDPDGGPLS